MAGNLVIVDAFPAFLEWWAEARGLDVDSQIEGWASRYMARWPELLARQQESYTSEGLDWREVARDHVFPFLDERLPAMVEAHRALRPDSGGLEAVYRRAVRPEGLGLDFSVTCVLYMGIGCGAGWATTFRGKPAILFGLENIAECGWLHPDTLQAMAAHELGHLAHQQWRSRAGLPAEPAEPDPVWQLYEEGLAQWSEHRVMGRDTWHEQAGQDGWLAWCAANRSWLAAAFLSAVHAGHPVKPFFGSWSAIDGRRQSGYFLGHEIIQDWAGSMDLRAMAVLPLAEIRRRVTASLVTLAGSAEPLPIGGDDDA